MNKISLYITGAIVLLSLILGNIKSCQVIKDLKNDNARLSENFKNSSFKLDSVQGKNGELHYTVKGLILTKDELEDSNQELTEQLEDMRIKLRNVSGVTKTNIQYMFVHDTVFVSTRDSISQNYHSTIENEYVKSSWDSKLVSIDSLQISNYKVSLIDSLSVVTETTYKGWWIFRKAKGIKVHIKSENPYSKIDKIEYIQIKSK